MLVIFILIILSVLVAIAVITTDYTTIHLSNDGQRWDVHIACLKEWDEIDWTQPNNLPKGVYLTRTKKLVTMRRDLTTCLDCKKT